MTQITVVAMVADKATITLYLDDGTDMVLNSSEYRTQEIVDKIMPFISNHKKAKIDIEDFHDYGKFEKKTGGLVRFFRMAKSAVSSIFGSELETKSPVSIEPDIPQPIHAPAPRMTAAQVEATGSKTIHHQLSESDTIVAVVGTGDKARAIPHMEKLQSQFANAITGSEIGMVRFLERISAVIDQRGHSVEDLLKFLEKGDLPIADDGSVISYKALQKIDGETYVDCHTRKIKQFIGSHVFMEPKMVDPSRRNDCSHGLHIARRDYLGSFSGNVIVLCKINPEDFIAVPEYSPSKVRVCGYHILFELPKEVEKLLRSNKPMTDNDVAAKMLGAAISGDHVGIIETVEIRGNQGTDVVITPVNSDKPIMSAPRMTGKAAKALATEKAQQPPSEGMTPKELHQKAETMRAKPKTPKKVKKVVDKPAPAPNMPMPVTASVLSKAEQCQAHYTKWATSGKSADWDAMMAIKKQAKKSFAALGLEPHQLKAVENNLVRLKTKSNLLKNIL